MTPLPLLIVSVWPASEAARCGTAVGSRDVPLVAAAEALFSSATEPVAVVAV